MQIEPFRGLFYNRDIVSIEDVVSPPWDVIATPSLYSSYNIVHIDLKKDKALFDRLLAEGVLIHDSKPAVYVYQQEYSWDGAKRRRTGFVAVVRMEKYGKSTIMPHEKVIADHIDDRVDSLRAFRTNFSPVFALHQGSIELETDGDAMIEVEHEGITNRVWAIYDEKAIDRIQQEVSSKQLYVADGHHRYGSGLKYMEENPDADHILMFLAPMDENLAILPSHRVIDRRIDLDMINTVFDLYGPATENPAADGITMYQDGVYYSLEVRNKESLSDIIELHAALGGLDAGISYIKDANEAIDRADDISGTAFLVNAVTTEEIVRVCNAGRIFPQKATYFYPKILSGLVMYKF